MNSLPLPSSLSMAMVPPIRSTMFLVMDMPQAGALNAADGGAFLPGELLKDVLLELLAHADAVVLDAELIARPGPWAHRSSGQCGC